MEVDTGDEQPKILVAEPLEPTPLSCLTIAELESICNILDSVSDRALFFREKVKIIREIKKRYNL